MPALGGALEDRDFLLPPRSKLLLLLKLNHDPKGQPGTGAFSLSINHKPPSFCPLGKKTQLKSGLMPSSGFHTAGSRGVPSPPQVSNVYLCELCLICIGQNPPGELKGLKLCLWGNLAGPLPTANTGAAPEVVPVATFPSGTARVRLSVQRQ